ncbi:hypothetical protein ACFWVP_22505 [Streptomyces sp. NPDC058637]|uniref:hypothetical protein n=1 Tax=Streptomyces sp. NPDC058637 TaxID=3346569 RepID=UPI003664ACF0
MAGLPGDFDGLRTTVNEGMKLLAPLTGAGLIARYGAVSVVLLGALAFALAVLVFVRLRVREPAGAPRVSRRYGGDTTAARFAGAAPAGVRRGRSPAYTGVLYAGGAGRGFRDRRAAGGAAPTAVARRRLRGGGDRPVHPVGGGAGAAVRGGGPGGGRGDRPRSAVRAGRRTDGGAAGAPDAAPGRTAAAAHTLTMVPNALGPTLGAGPVSVADVRLLLPSAALAGLVTAVWVGAGRQGRPTGAPAGGRSPADA